MKIMAAWFAGKHEKAMDVASRVLGRQGSWTVPLRWAEYSWNRDRNCIQEADFQRQMNILRTAGDALLCRSFMAFV
ncbi:hypothetical protein ACX12E_25295 [Paenibacillus vandeheii]